MILEGVVGVGLMDGRELVGVDTLNESWVIAVTSRVASGTSVGAVEALVSFSGSSGPVEAVLMMLAEEIVNASIRVPGVVVGSLVCASTAVVDVQVSVPCVLVGADVVLDISGAGATTPCSSLCGGGEISGVGVTSSCSTLCGGGGTAGSVVIPSTTSSGLLVGGVKLRRGET